MNVIVKAGSRRDAVRVKVKGESKKGTKNYFSEIKEELKKVSWPLKDELKTCTKIVISGTFIFGLGIYIADLVIKGVLDGIGAFARLLFG